MFLTIFYTEKLWLKVFYFNLVICFYYGSYLAVLRIYSRFCAQETFLIWLRETYMVLLLEPGLVDYKQVHYPLY